MCKDIKSKNIGVKEEGGRKRDGQMFEETKN